MKRGLKQTKREMKGQFLGRFVWPETKSETFALFFKKPATGCIVWRMTMEWVKEGEGGPTDWTLPHSLGIILGSAAGERPAKEIEGGGGEGEEESTTALLLVPLWRVIMTLGTEFPRKVDFTSHTRCTGRTDKHVYQ